MPKGTLLRDVGIYVERCNLVNITHAAETLSAETRQTATANLSFPTKLGIVDPRD